MEPEKYMKKSRPNISIFDENYKPINSRNSTYLKSKKYGENYTKVQHNQIAENQSEIVKNKPTQ